MDRSPAARYNRALRVLTLASFFLPMALLYLFMKLDWSQRFSEYSLHLMGNYYAALLFYWTVLQLAMTAIRAAVNAGSYRLERIHNLTRQSYSSWLGDYLKRSLLNWLVTSIGVAWFYCAVRNSAEHWYLWFWLAIVLFHAGVLLLLDSLFLPFFYRMVPLESGEVFERLSSLATRASISRPKFIILQVGHKTARTNALVTGLAGVYRILITDTVLETFTLDEIEAIVAHEMGHQAKHHTTKRLLILGALYFGPLWVAHLVFPDMISSLSNFAYLPYLFISFCVIHQYLLVLFCVFARMQEESADRFCWNLTGNVPAFVSMMRKAAAQNLMPQGTKRTAASHPAVEARIAAAENFLKQQGAASAAAGQTG
jgi:STE24 endopeptidase